MHLLVHKCEGSSVGSPHKCSAPDAGGAGMAPLPRARLVHDAHAVLPPSPTADLWTAGCVCAAQPYFGAAILWHGTAILWHAVGCTRADAATPPLLCAAPQVVQVLLAPTQAGNLEPRKAYHRQLRLVPLRNEDARRRGRTGMGVWAGCSARVQEGGGRRQASAHRIRKLRDAYALWCCANAWASARGSRRPARGSVTSHPLECDGGSWTFAKMEIECVCAHLCLTCTNKQYVCAP